MKICNSCQVIQEDTNKFCKACGYSSFTPVLEQSPPVSVKMSPASKSMTKARKRGIVFAIAGVAVALAVLAFFLFNYFSPVNRFIRCIRNDEFSEAAEIYQESIVSDTNDYQKAYDKVSSHVEELVEKYRNQSISYDYLMDKLRGIDHVGILGREIYYAYEEADYLLSCREAFSAAEDAFANGRYREAIRLYAQITDASFENREEASKKHQQSIDLFRAETISRAQEYIDLEEYTLAIVLLDDALDVIPGDSELLSLVQTCTQTEYDHTIQELLEEARTYIARCDFAEALTFIDSCVWNYPDESLFVQEKNDCLRKYEDYVINESLRLARAGEYQQALSLAETSLHYFSNAQVKELIAIYKSRLPVILENMPIFQNNTEGGSWLTKTDKINKYLEDNYGNTYANSLSVGRGSITYLVNYKYETFSGTVAFPKGLESDSFRESATLTIWGDDEKIAEFTNVNEATKPEAFSLDISAYERVTLSWSCKGGNIWDDWGDFATIFDGVFVPVPLDLPAGT